jgi:hypothetical protein
VSGFSRTARLGLGGSSSYRRTYCAFQRSLFSVPDVASSTRQLNSLLSSTVWRATGKGIGSWQQRIIGKRIQGLQKVSLPNLTSSPVAFCRSYPSTGETAKGRLNLQPTQKSSFQNGGLLRERTPELKPGKTKNPCGKRCATLM